MKLSNSTEVNRWLDSIVDPKVQKELHNMRTRGEIPEIFIPDAITEKARWKVHPEELEAIRTFGDMPFNSV